ncbi:MAG TPA: hypothetical protein VGW10_06250 [Solirubrobacteraceae bacterium]|nr:hypothetical protein [Solirubrobacteraceae bacterium]
MRGARAAAVAGLLLCVVVPSPAAGQGAATEPAAPASEIAALRERVDDLSANAATEKPNEKDAWDKLSSIAGLVSGLLVALIGAFATYVYNDRQSKTQAAQSEREVAVQQVQTVAGFMPTCSRPTPSGGRRH